jgi:hypothetical protein
MRSWLVVLISLAAVLLVFGATSPAGAEPPNIIVIQTDDQDNGTVNERAMPHSFA